jgi:hypothetical protein
MSYKVLTVIALRYTGRNQIFTPEYRVMYEAKRTDMQFSVSSLAVTHLTYGHTITCF